MVKRTLVFILTLLTLNVFSQAIVQRAGISNTVSDNRLAAKLNFFLPRYQDTTAANLQKGIDTCGAIISTYDNRLWKRDCNPKQWTEYGSLKASDTTGKWVARVFRKAGSDSVFAVVTGTSVFQFRDSVGVPVDTLPLSNRINQLVARRDTFSLTQPNDTTLIFYTPVIGRRDTVLFKTGATIDTTSLSARINKKVDSITFNRFNGIDSVKFWVNGTSYVAGYVPRKDGLISGGVVTWVSGLTFEVSAAIYTINGVLYSSPTAQVTLTAADSTNPRIDLIAVNTLGGVVGIAGTAAVTPAEPQANPATQLALTSVYIPATSTVPQGVSQTVVYDENSEWTTSTSGTITANFASIAIAAKNGTKEIAVSSFNSGSSLRFTNGSTVPRNNYTAVKFWVYLTVALTNQDIYVQFFSGNRSVSDQQRAVFTKGSIGGWQSVSLNLSQFAFTSTSFDRIQLAFSGSSASTLYIDYLVLQGGLNQTGGFTETDPIYTANGVPKTRQLTINGTPFDLSADRSWTIPTQTSSYQTATAAGTTTFTFTNVPAQYDDYLVFRNGVLLAPTTSYTTSGNVITIPAVVSGDIIQFRRIK